MSAYAFIHVISVALSLGEDEVWEEYFSLQCKGKTCYHVFELSSQKAALTVEMVTASSLVLGIVGFRKRHRFAVN